jgi:hypothetical protein
LLRVGEYGEDIITEEQACREFVIAANTARRWTERRWPQLDDRQPYCELLLAWNQGNAGGGGPKMCRKRHVRRSEFQAIQDGLNAESGLRLIRESAEVNDTTYARIDKWIKRRELLNTVAIPSNEIRSNGKARQPNRRNARHVHDNDVREMMRGRFQLPLVARFCRTTEKKIRDLAGRGEVTLIRGRGLLDNGHVDDVDYVSLIEVRTALHPFDADQGITKTALKNATGLQTAKIQELVEDGTLICRPATIWNGSRNIPTEVFDPVTAQALIEKRKNERLVAENRAKADFDPTRITWNRALRKFGMFDMGAELWKLLKPLIAPYRREGVTVKTSTGVRDRCSVDYPQAVLKAAILAANRGDDPAQIAEAIRAVQPPPKPEPMPSDARSTTSGTGTPAGNGNAQPASAENGSGEPKRLGRPSMKKRDDEIIKRARDMNLLNQPAQLRDVLNADDEFLTTFNKSEKFSREQVRMIITRWRSKRKREQNS